MDGRERFLAHFSEEVPDRVPLFLRDFTLGLDNLRVRTTDLFSDRYDLELASRSVISFGRLTGSDAIVGCVHSPAFIVEQFGGKLRYPEDGVPMVTDHPFTCPDSLDHADTDLKGKALDAIEAYHRTRDGCEDLAIIGNITGPLTKASVLMGVENLSLALDDDRGFVDEVIRTGTEATESFIEAVEADIDAVFIASATDNPSLFGKDVIEEVTVPYLKGLIDFIHDMGLPAIYHPHGDYCDKALMDSVIDTGIDGFQFAEQNDPSRICKLIDDRCVVMGGTDIVPTLYSGTEEEIRSETERYLKACSGSRYIFSCSCSLQRGTPIGNILAMCRYINN